MAGAVQDIVSLLQRSLDPREQKQAAAALEQAEASPDFSLALLQIVSDASFPQTTRLASALCFKNLVKRNWTDEEGTHKLPANEVRAIKSQLVALMIQTPPVIQAQLGDAISVIADSDFWQRWDTLIQDLVSRLSTTDPDTNNGVMQVAHSIFKRWRPLYRSDDLFTEINHVLATFTTPFLEILAVIDTAIEQNVSNKEALQKWMTCLNNAIKILHDLTCQDMPDALVDNLSGLTLLLQKYLKYDNVTLHTEDDAEAGPLEYVKGSILGLLTLWSGKYEEDVRSYIAMFVESSWTLLTSTGLDLKYDILASRALNFLTSVTRNPQHASAFNNEAILKQVIEGVILPNIALRESDVEMFEDEPIEYIRRDLEGSDSETRRRAATDFLHQLNDQFSDLVTSVTKQYYDSYLQQYAQDQTTNWRQKDTAVYLFCSIAAVGTITAAHGVRQVNPHVNVIDFFQSHIAQDLVSDKTHPILQVDAIKYLYIFRSQMSKDQWLEAFPLLIRHLSSPIYVVHTYCAIAVERTLALTSEADGPIIPRSTLQPLARNVLIQLFKLIEHSSAAEKLQENEFLMRCVMRVLIVSRDDIHPFYDIPLKNLINITNVIRHNPSNPRFYYYMFESLGALTRFIGPIEPDKLEQTLYEPFAAILRDDVQEFTPYVFQLFAALLEANPSGTMPNYYIALIPPVLAPSLWEAFGNRPALVRLLSGLLTRGSQHIVQNDQVEPILGIFQKLVSSKKSDGNGFDLLESTISALPPQSLQQYYSSIFTILLTRLSNSKTEAFTLRFVRLFHFMAARDDLGLGADFLNSTLNAIQPGIFGQIYTGVIMPETQKLSRPVDRKTAVVSLTKMLTDSTAFAEQYAKGWGYTCEALLKLMLNPPVPPANDDLIQDQDVDDTGFGVGFTQLSTCRRLQVDPFAGITDVKGWISQQLQQADGRHAGRINNFIQQRLTAETQQALVSYMQG